MKFTDALRLSDHDTVLSDNYRITVRWDEHEFMPWHAWTHDGRVVRATTFAEFARKLLDLGYPVSDGWEPV